MRANNYHKILQINILHPKIFRKKRKLKTIIRNNFSTHSE